MPGLIDQAPGETGFYGKIPTQGDFVTRRIPQRFVQHWDAWLQECVAYAREALGADWERLFREAPVWQYLLAPGTCGDVAWAGLIQPSVDRVGRYFPLTVAAQLPGDVQVLDTFVAARAWYDDIERAAAVAFEADGRLEDLDARVLAAPFPSGAVVRADAADDTLPLAERAVSALKVEAGRDNDLSYARTVLREEQVNVGHTHCVWLNASSAAPDRVLLVTRSLPAAQLSCALLDGDWASHGWDSGKTGLTLPV